MSWFRKRTTPERLKSSLYDEKTFYNKFTQDLLKAKKEIIIESPYITTSRMSQLRYVFENLVDRGVEVYVITRHPEENDKNLATQAENEIRYFEQIGVQPLLCDGGHHRKLAFIDRKILWEGSLNILSQCRSREIMRRFENEKTTEEMFNFLKLNKVI